MKVPVDEACHLAQAEASKAGGIAATVRLMAGPPAVRRVAVELLRELMPALRASQDAEDTSVYDTFAQVRTRLGPKQSTPALFSLFSTSMIQGAAAGSMCLT